MAFLAALPEILGVGAEAGAGAAAAGAGEAAAAGGAEAAGAGAEAGAGAAGGGGGLRDFNDKLIGHALGSAGGNMIRGIMGGGGSQTGNNFDIGPIGRGKFGIA